ncbi:MAG: tryptophan 2,3-dioxygenase family protein, partial [Acidimicrobiales bacterium]
PESFFEFRDPLAPASGFQSIQFREIEALSGGLGATPGAVVTFDEAGKERVAARTREPTLWDAARTALTSHGLLDSEADEGGQAELEAVTAIYREHKGALRSAFHQLFEALVDHDEAMATWRYRHLLMAAREIGSRPGTGGSLGVEYLQRTLEKRYFPVLWEVRSRL